MNTREFFNKYRLIWIQVAIVAICTLLYRLYWRHAPLKEAITTTLLIVSFQLVGWIALYFAERRPPSR